MPTAAQAAIMFASGLGIPILAALNAALGRHIGSPSTAALILFTVAMAVAAVATVLTGPAALSRIAQAPWTLFLGGTFVAFYVLAVTYIAPTFGIGNAVFLVLLGQMASSALIDQFGLFGALQQPLTLSRGGGLALMAAGVALIRFG